VYNFATHTREQNEHVLDRHPVVIFEGLWLLHRPALRRFFQLSIFIDATSDLCLQRRVSRDVAERGRCPEEVNSWFNERVLPMQRRFVDPQREYSTLTVCAPVGEKHVTELAEKILNLS